MKDVLQVTISKANPPKSKLGKWWYWNIYWPIFKVWKPRILSKIYRTIALVLLALLPKEERTKILKEFKNLKVNVKDKNKM